MALTPNNRDREIPKDPETIDECWITTTTYPTYTGITNDDIIDDCSAVNEMCNRKFNHQVIDQTFMDVSFFMSQYQYFALDNGPISYVSDIYLQGGDTFALVDDQYLQVFTEERGIKVVPFLTFSPTIQNTIFNLPSTQYHLWVRYASGFRVNGDDDETYPEVPRPVQRATILMAKYLANLSGVQPNVTSFSTQTYSQKNSLPSDDPILSRVKEFLKPYKQIYVK
jgi:hypothetical protein